MKFPIITTEGGEVDRLIVETPDSDKVLIYYPISQSANIFDKNSVQRIIGHDQYFSPNLPIPIKKYFKPLIMREQDIEKNIFSVFIKDNSRIRLLVRYNDRYFILDGNFQPFDPNVYDIKTLIQDLRLFNYNYFGPLKCTLK